MKTRLIKIGNSQGIRIPKLLLEQVGLANEVELEVQQDQIVIRPPNIRATAGMNNSKPWRNTTTMRYSIAIVSTSLPGMRMSGNGSQTI